MVSDDVYRESLFLRGDHITERLQALHSPSPPVPVLRSRKPLWESGGLTTSFERQLSQTQSSPSEFGYRSMPAQVNTALATRLMARQSMALPRSRVVYDPILHHTSVFHIHNGAATGRVDRQSYRSSFGHTGQRSPHIPAVRADYRRQKGLAENVIGLQHREMGGYDDPVPLLAPPRASPSSQSPHASPPRSFPLSPSVPSRSLLDHGCEYDRKGFRPLGGYS